MAPRKKARSAEELREAKSEVGRLLVGFRHAALTGKQRSDIAKKAAKARWAKKKPRAKKPLK